MAPAAACLVVVDAPAPALVASCALETFPTHAGTWVRCHAHDWQQLTTPTAAPSLRCPHEVR
jgi:hypothetical protein